MAITRGFWRRAQVADLPAISRTVRSLDAAAGRLELEMLAVASLGLALAARGAAVARQRILAAHRERSVTVATLRWATATQSTRLERVQAVEDRARPFPVEESSSSDGHPVIS